MISLTSDRCDRIMYRFSSPLVLNLSSIWAESPAPTISKKAFGRTFATSINTSTKKSWFFWSANLPTCPTTNAFWGILSFFLSISEVKLIFWNRITSIPFQMTTVLSISNIRLSSCAISLCKAINCKLLLRTSFSAALRSPIRSPPKTLSGTLWQVKSKRIPSNADPTRATSFSTIKCICITFAFSLRMIFLSLCGIYHQPNALFQIRTAIFHRG